MAAGADAPTLLQAFSHAQRPGEAVLLRILVSLLEAVQVLHQSGTVHGGLGPDTVSLDATGQGLPAAARRVNPLLVVPGRCGHLQVTPGYSPLEAYLSRAEGLSPACDLYAIGAIAFWLMTGEHPEEAPARALEDRLPVLSGRADLGGYSRDLRAAVDTCLWLAPADRPQQAGPLLATLAGLEARQAARDAAPSCAIFAPDPQQLDGLRALLHGHLLPPVVTALFAQAQRKASNWQAYCEEIASHIDDAGIREQLRLRAAAPAAAPQQAVPFSPALLQALESELKEHLGAVARVVIRRAATQAQDRPGLYRMIGAEIENPAQARKFLAWAESTLGA